jgi:CMP-N,N'-diacetyllegionaminic acid synthase
MKRRSEQQLPRPAEQSRSVIAVIPARGGSRRIPHKNLALLGNRPLIDYTIQAALGSQHVTKVVVSTDDEQIAAVSRRCGAEVVWRPAELAVETAPTEPALLHAVREVERHLGRPADLVALLQATSPLRGACRIDEAIDLLDETGSDTVVSVVPDVSYYFLGDIDADGRFNVNYDPSSRLRTQDIPPRYRENGAIYVARRDHLIQSGCRMGGRMRALVMSERESVDIDTMQDLRFCRTLLDVPSGSRQVRQRWRTNKAVHETMNPH